MTVKDVLSLIKRDGVEVVDLRFMDFPGLWQHFSIPAREVDEDTFESGLGFDGSSIRGWQAINESDMLVKPVSETAFIDPFFQAKTLVLICNICDPVTGEESPELRDRGDRKLRPRGGVLHLRRHPLRPERARRVFSHRQRGRPMECRTH